MDKSLTILVIQLKRAGDVILTTPVAAVLKGRWPHARIDFLVDKAFSPVLENNPAIENVWLFNREQPWKTWAQIRAQKYDRIFDFQSSPRSALAVLFSGARETAGYQVPFWGHVYTRTVKRPGTDLSVVDGKMSLLEAATGPLKKVPEPSIFLKHEEREWANRFQEAIPGKRRWIGLIPTHRRNSRRWHADSFATLARQLDQEGFTIWLFWGPGEKDYVEAIQKAAPQSLLIPPTSLRQMAALLARCELVVTNDNGPMHIAAAVGTPTITIYGPTDPFAWNPGGPRHRVLQANELHCIRCNLNECPYGHECMKLITPAMVFTVVKEVLSKRPEWVVI
jgi:lipopolysaccharide heptosyltransferase II